MRNLARFVLIVALAAMSGPVTRADTIVTHIVQCALNRLYFPVGTESFVYPGCRYLALRDGQPVIEGQIEFSVPGIAVTYETGLSCDSLMAPLMEIQIETYSVDTASSLVFGQAIGPWFDLFLVSDTPTLPAADRVTVRAYGWGDRARDQMLFDFESGTLDGYFSYQEPVARTGAGALRVAAPWIVVLMPNPDRPVNSGGLLTTALYYAYDSSRLGLMFSGDNPVGTSTFVPVLDRKSRPFACDPNRARELLHAALGERRDIVISITDPSLRSTAAYFADILARERVTSQIVTDRTVSDCYLMFAPVDLYDDGYTLRYVLARLEESDVKTPGLRESLAVVRAHLDRARNAGVGERYAYLRLAESRIIEDVGVFPLFRPVIHVLSAHDIGGIAADETGRINLSRAYRLAPPADSIGGVW